MNGTPVMPDPVRALGILIDGLADAAFECVALDAFECEELLNRAGLLVRVAADEEQAAKLEDVEVGDDISVLTEFARRCRQQAREPST